MSDVLDRFLRYVQVDSPSNPAHADTVPSTPEQHDMAKLLEAELKELGLTEVVRDEHAYVVASIPASEAAEDLPALGLIAHIDSSSSVPGHGVKPHIVRYEGGELVIGKAGAKLITVSPDEIPDLNNLVGEDIVCSDGTTLLSCDDKAGVAAIMALLARLTANKDLPHPTLKIAFVPDEEIGHGASLLNLEEFGASWAYTVDGEALGQVSYETFNAAAAELTINGVNVHPGSAKDIMINAISVFREFDALLPAQERPEHTEGYEGYYHCTNVEGNESCVKAHYIIRDFDAEQFAQRQQKLLDRATQLNEHYGEDTVVVELHEEYRNMAETISQTMFLVDNALEANREVGVEPFVEAVRGGTDGSQLTLRGLPCPNIATGGYNMHSVREFVAVSALEKTVDVLEKLVGKFAVPQQA